MTSIASHALDRLCALHLISGLLDAATVPVRDGGLTPEERGRAAVICSRLAQCVERCKAMAPDASNDPRLVNRILRMNDVIWRSYGEEVDARDAVAMAMYRVAAEEEAIPRQPRLLAKRLEWGQLHTLLGQLYEAIDLDVTGIQQIDHGAVGVLWGVFLRIERWAREAERREKEGNGK